MRESCGDNMNQGRVYIFTGEGKGKTSAALGILLRSLSHGWRACWISWYKQASWGISEHTLDTILNTQTQKRLSFFPMGEGFYIQSEEKKAQVKKGVVVDHAKKEEHIHAAQHALKKAEEMLHTVDVLFLDEICNAISDGLLEEKDVIAFIKKRKTTHIIITGRNASSSLIEHADLVSEIQKVKHPYDKGIMAIQGLDF